MGGVNTAGVRAEAEIRARADGRGGTALPVLESRGPLALRRTRGSGATAHVSVVGAMSGPHGGDHFTVRADVGTGARLRVGSAAATLALPGQHGGRARQDVRITVAAGGELHWLPEPLISVRGSELAVHTHVALESGARLVLREELVLGRTGEAPGRLTSRLTVRVDGRPVLDQQLDCGSGAPGGWDGPAVLGGHRAAGQLVVVDAEFTEKPIAPGVPADGLAVLPLSGPAVLVSAVAPDALRLRRLLDRGPASFTPASPASA
ncbi:urease accessory protein UreD [Streptomyces griseoincarnatus]|uniref:Urease accessory protein UreD n=1 Tax=Streptomyces griseoincarnatus TaxID=29305 RepID=A0ABT0VVE3_STRGI|nr:MULTISPECIES: urease accessory protein UreD [Streptomyces]MBJ6612276.1 urease accessory protein UreD [Streptomyces sp. I3(2020)]MBJ6627508.1 urease accessory protein UreD [Streptomyces sp. I4(2020)]MCM2514480.1 urease accessory protein UreD [Streptomyces griseoincarnatus]